MTRKKAEATKVRHCLTITTDDMQITYDFRSREDFARFMKAVTDFVIAKTQHFEEEGRVQ